MRGLSGFDAREMQILVALVGILAVAIVWRDSFETIILRRRVAARLRVSKIFYQVTWRPWRAAGRRLRSSDWRETFLSTYGPLSLIALFVLWGAILMAGFAALLWAAGFDVNLSGPGHLYVSGTTFTTLGIGDFTPHTDLARFLTVVEAGTGFGFLAILISYLPVLYQSFSRREIANSTLPARAGPPPPPRGLLPPPPHSRQVGELIPFIWRRETLAPQLR